MAETILLVEDDPSISRGLTMNLALEGFRAVAAADGEEALRLVQTQRPDLIVVDLMLPKIDGLEIIRRLRAQNEDMPIVVLSAKGDEADKVLALSVGADDYVTKPFGLAELIARIRAALRRRRHERGAQRDMEFGVVRLDLAGRRITVRGTEVESTAKEFDLLRCFVQSPGVVFTREQLMQRVWGADHFGTVRTVDNFVARLRSKIELDLNAPHHIETVRGIGYRFNA